MSERPYIHGGTDPREVARLEKQARFLSPFILKRFVAKRGDRVLDLATGVGAMAEELVARFPGIRLYGLDLNRAQLATAHRRHPIAAYVEGDGARMPFRDGTFDAVHCSWLLEHVPDPVAVLREVRRVLAPGATCHFTEVDNASFQTTPAYPEVQQAMDALNRAQQQAGGDPFVGPKLPELFRAAGFSTVDVRPSPLDGTASDPAGYVGFVEEFAEIFESLDEALGPSMAPVLHTAAEQLRRLPSVPNSKMHYASVIGRATR